MNVFQGTVPMMRGQYELGNRGAQGLDLHGLLSLITWIATVYVLVALGRYLWKKADKLK